MSLTPKQKRFINEYLIDLNATQAAIRAGYSPKTANEQASRMLANVNISDIVDKAMAERAKRTGISAERVLEELAKIGFANITDVANLDDASTRDAAVRDDTAAIQSIKVKIIPTENGEIIEREIKMHDKTRALTKLGEHLNIFNGGEKDKTAGIMAELVKDLKDDIHGEAT
jgi:phage terminase small subunit